MKKLFDIELTDEEFDNLMYEQSHGKELKVVNGKVVAVERVATQEELKNQRIAEIKQRLEELNKDFIQYYLGAIIPNIEDKKIEFISLHNELRELLGKEPRIYK